jgi:hypothetical protein
VEVLNPEKNLLCFKNTKRVLKRKRSTQRLFLKFVKHTSKKVTEILTIQNLRLFFSLRFQLAHKGMASFIHRAGN